MSPQWCKQIECVLILSVVYKKQHWVTVFVGISHSSKINDCMDAWKRAQTYQYVWNINVFFKNPSPLSAVHFCSEQLQSPKPSTRNLRTKLINHLFDIPLFWKCKNKIHAASGHDKCNKIQLIFLESIVHSVAVSSW